MAIRQVSVWLLLLGLLSAGIVSPAAAAIPDYGYNYSYWREAEPAPYPYLAEKQIYGSALGIGDFNDPQDVFVSSDQHIFIADTNNNRIIHLDDSGELVDVISTFEIGRASCRERVL